MVVVMVDKLTGNVKLTLCLYDILYQFQGFSISKLEQQHFFNLVL